MTSTKNIQKLLVAALFAAGLGLLLVGVRAEFPSFSSGDEEFPVGRELLSIQHIPHASLNDANLPKLYKEVAAARTHKNLYKHFRGRLSLDLFSAAHTIGSERPRTMLFPHGKSGTNMPAVLAELSLRGPPCS